MPNVIVIRNDYIDSGALFRVLEYALRDALKGGYAVNPDYAYPQMSMVKNAYHKTEGVQLKHFIVSFSNTEFGYLDFDELMNIGLEVCRVFVEYQIAFSIHLDSGNVHMHFVMNTVSFLDGHKYAAGLVKFNEVRILLQEMLPQFRSGLFQSRKYSIGDPFTLEDEGRFERLT